MIWLAIICAFIAGLSFGGFIQKKYTESKLEHKYTWLCGVKNCTFKITSTHYDVMERVAMVHATTHKNDDTQIATVITLPHGKGMWPTLWLGKKNDSFADNDWD